MEPTVKSFPVNYPDGTSVLVKRVPAAKLEDLSQLQAGLFERFFKYYTYSRNCLGDVLADAGCRKYIEDIAAILIVVGQSKPGLNLKQLWDDYEQLGQIFLTESFDAATGLIVIQEDESLAASKIAALHNQHFFRVEAVESYRKRRDAEESATTLTTNKEDEKASPEVEIPLPTP